MDQQENYSNQSDVDKTPSNNGTLGAPMQAKVSKRMMKAYHLTGAPKESDFITVTIEPLNETFAKKELDLMAGESVKIGRQVSPKQPTSSNNGLFDSKVLSRQHADIWAEDGKVFIKDVGSSNGTFLNGQRLSGESLPSMPFQIHSGDTLEFGVDIMNEDNTAVVHQKVSCRLTVSSDKRETLPSKSGNTLSEPNAPTIAPNTSVSSTVQETQKLKSNNKDLEKISQNLAEITNVLTSKDVGGEQSQTKDQKNTEHELKQLREKFKAEQDSLRNSLTQEIDRLKNELDISAAECLKIGQELSKTQNQLAEKQVNIKNSEQEHQKILLAHQELNKKYESEQKTLISERSKFTQLEQQLKDSQKVASDLKQQLQSKDAQISKQSAQINDFQRKIEELQGVSNKMKTLSSEKNEMAKQLEAKKSQVAKLEAELETQQKTIKESRTLIEELKKKRASVHQETATDGLVRMNTTASNTQSSVMSSAGTMTQTQSTKKTGFSISPILQSTLVALISVLLSYVMFRYEPDVMNPIAPSSTFAEAPAIDLD